MLDGGQLRQRYRGVHDGKTVIETIGTVDDALAKARLGRDMGLDRAESDRDLETRALYTIPPIIWHKLAKESGIPFNQQRELDAYIHKRIMRDSEYSKFRIWERG